MESTDSSSGSQQQPNLPPGFRFHPTDEELVVHYLKKKTTSTPLPVAIIAEVDLYKFDPWELPAKATFGEQEWYFFSPRDRKYPNGARPNRAATSGYWKATGTDKPVLTSGGAQKVGVKKALVFYKGKPPKGIKTNWIMHEYRLADNKVNNKPPGCDYGNKKNSLRLDDWVLCRIYKKNNISNRLMDHDKDDSMEIMLANIPPSMAILHQHHNSKLFQHHLPNFGNQLLENSYHTGIFQGSINANEGFNNNVVPSSSIAQLSTDPDAFSMKRTLSSSMFWTEEDDHQASNKRVHEEDVTLLSQLPESTSFPQQTMLGSFGDNTFRQSYNQLHGLNWYS